MKLNKVLVAINLMLMLVMTSYAEGTKELWPSGAANEKIGPQIWDNADPDRQFATYNSGVNYRLNIHISDLTEKIYYGFNVDGSAFNGNVYYRIKDPNGNVVFGPALVPTSGAGFIQNHGEAILGPDIVDINGYQSLSFQPTILGDYYIEFNPSSPTVLTRLNTRFQFFDVSVVKGVQPQLGRLWSRNWDLSNYSFANSVQSSVFVYSTDGVVSELDMNGLQPFGFEIACNNTGPVDTGNPFTDRQSKTGKLTYALYKIFLNDPDNLAYPTGTFSSFGSRPAYLSGCSGSYCVNVDYDGGGYAEVLLDFNNNSINDGDDVVLTANVLGGYHCFPWDGKDAAGNTITHAFNMNIEATILAGLTHYPVYDAENHPNGFIINVVRPIVPTPVIFYDDTPVGGGSDLIGCATPCHTWTGNFGDVITINTWWYGASVSNNIALLNNQCDPIAVNDIVSTYFETPVNIDAIVNDTDSDGDDIFIVSAGTDVGNGVTFANGAITVNDNSTPADNTDDYFVYTPDNGFKGIDSVYYYMNDEQGGRDTAVIYIFVDFDLDQDGQLGLADLDSDNDGILDTDEDGGTGFDPSGDEDGDGIPNYIDWDDTTPGFVAFVDANGDGTNDLFDTDMDGAPDHLDFDSDNDGIPDAVEANNGQEPLGYDISFGYIIGSDGDNDGLLDVVDNDPFVAFGPGSTSTQPLNDTDGDGVIDVLDSDSDNDGIFDVVEAGGTDVDNDGIIDGFSDSNGDGYFDGANINYLSIPDTDGDGFPNFLDIDSDNDGIDDSREAFSTPNDPNPFTYTDTDGDGVVDQFDVDNGGVTAIPVDTDNDGTPDYLDLDSDGDGSPDIIESNDADLNGIADSAPSGLDADNDGLDDAFDSDAGWGGESTVPEQNQDGDSQPDWRDLYDTQNPGIFYYVCDATDELYSFNPYSGSSALIGSTAVTNIEAIAYWNGILYAANAGDFGTLDLSTGVFTLIGEIDGGGTASGAIGLQTLNDVDGLSFDPFTGILWASNRRGTPGDGQNDLLFQIDITTGLVVSDAFGTGTDYLVVGGLGVFDDVDDIAVNPINGKIYTIGNNGSGDQVVEINKLTGAITIVAPASESDVEGMAYFNDGTFYGTIGTTAEFWTIDPVTGSMTNSQSLACGDPEALAALVAPVNTITGTIWEDVNTDGILDAGETTGIPNVTVNLYHDINGNGIIDPSDLLLQSVETDVNGDYTFLFGTTANLLMEVDLTTLPAGYALTTDNIESAVFADNTNFNETDSGNNFGAAGGADCDSDGIPDFAEGGVGVDSDGDGIDNMCDLDSDNDGIPDRNETTVDSDNDGIADYIDLDSDNDGIPDAIEANNGVQPTGYDINTGRITGNDGDLDGLIDAVDDNPSVQYGTSGTTLPVADNDGEGIPDYLDLDSDNDGIHDIYEGHTDFTALYAYDTDGDGAIDVLSDGNSDGYHDPLNSDPFTIPNSDGNGFPNYIDMDSDGDGIDDTREGLPTGSYGQPTIFVDNNNNGIIDYWDNDLGGTGIIPNDQDGDGIPDFMDTDSDNDLVLDIIEGNDANADGIADTSPSGSDIDGDGIDDTFDQDCVSTSPGFSSYDYAEERVSDGNINLGSSDLEFINDGGTLQTVGLAFNNISIPQGTAITSAYIQFATDEAMTGAVTVTIHGEDTDNATSFTNTNFNVSGRTTTTASSSWSPADWNTIGESGVNQRSSSLTAIVQEIVNRGGWTAGNNMNFIFTGANGNRRTAETYAQLVVIYAGSSNAWGCATNTPHQDFDGDGEDDWRDTDDDDDGILTENENADIDGNGTPDYLEIAPCPERFTLQVVENHALNVFSNNGVISPNNALNAPNGVYADMPNNKSFILDLGSIFAPGANVVFTISEIGSNGGKAEIEESIDGSSKVNKLTYTATTSVPVFETYSYVLSQASRYLHIKAKKNIALDALTITTSSCEADWDMDGIPNNVDLDDDNDGISDLLEGVLDTDGDGQIDALDLDSDNDGIPDAVEANGGTLPADMNAQGQYSAAFISDPTNDLNSNGWYEATEGGESYASNFVAPLDSDGDFIPDNLDLDADGDGILDAVEANTGILPANMDNNGQYPSTYAVLNDTDGDGIIDDLDPNDGGTMLVNPDTDGDGIPNYLDLDSDGDLISDNLEGFSPDLTAVPNDADADGLDDAFDPDQGGVTANLPDEDCNLLVDYLDGIKNTAVSGIFTTGGTWANGIVPTPGKSIVIATGHTLTLTGNTNVASVFIQTGGVLDIAGYDLTVTGYFQVDGDFIHNNGKVLLSGTCTQTVCGDLVFFDLEIDNAAGVNMDCGNIAVSNELVLTEGIMSTCSANSFTMQSTATGTAYIAGSGTGTVICDVTFERYKQGCADGWMSLGSPFVSNTLNDWDDDVVTTGFTGSDFPSFSFVSMHSYNETLAGAVDVGWTAPTSINDPIVRGKGYYVYEGTANYPMTIDITGTPNLNTFTFPIKYTNHGSAANDGWNLLANPFPSAIEWDLTDPSKWINVGCCDATYVWNECVDQFASYIDQVGTNDGASVIPSSSAFWVKAHFAGASLQCTREAMVPDYGDFRSSNVNHVDEVMTIHIDGFSKEDEVKFRVLSTASHGHDDFGDALKIESDETNMGIYIKDNQMGMNNSIEAFPNDGTNKVIPIYVRVPATGSYTLDFTGGSTLPSDMCFIFEDLLTGTSFDLKTATFYTCNIDSVATFENRFIVNVSYPIEPVITDLSCKGASDGSIVFEANGVGPYDVIWTDALGNIIRQVTTSSNDTLQGLAAGDYTLNVIDNGASQCNNGSKTVTVSEPVNGLNVSGLAHNQNCDGSNGYININVGGGQAPYTYVWSNGVTIQDNNSVAPGTYQVEVTDANGCQNVQSYVVAPTVGVTAAFTLPSDTIVSSNGETVNPINTSSANHYVWYWGDGNVSVDAQPEYTYMQDGNYDITLVASTNGCTDTVVQSVTVTGTIGYEEVANENGVSTYFADNKIWITFEESPASNVAINVYDAQGKLVIVEQGQAGNTRFVLPVGDLSNGNYIVTIESNTLNLRQKVNVVR